MEILIVIYLCRRNATDAVARGRSRSIAVSYTCFFCFGFEMMGLFWGTVMANLLSIPLHILWLWLFALGFAFLGGLISRRIAKRKR